MDIIKCRVCSTKTANYSSLLESNILFKEKRPLMDYIERVASVHLRMTEERSHVLCEDCLTKLGISFEFIEKVRQSENYLSLLNDTSFGSENEPDGGGYVKINTNDFVKTNDDKTAINELQSEMISPIIQKNITVVKFCTLCKEEVPMEIVKDHILSHRDSGGNYGCSKCEKQFNSYRLLKKHNETVHEIKPRKISVKTAKTKKKRRKNSTQTRICLICKVEMGWVDMKMHILTHQDSNGNFDCGKCGKKYPGYRELRSHFRKHSENRGSKKPLTRSRICCICHVKKLWGEMESHILIHQDENGSFKCPKCEIKKETYGKIRTHILGMHEKSECVCPHCGIMLATYNTYTAHIKKHTVREFKCKQCPRIFREPSQLKYHVQTRHSLEKTFVCNVCGHKFWTNYKLNGHMRNYHQSDSHCKCEVCGREFANKVSMKNHMRYHSKPTKKCPHCSALFIFSRELKMHISKHTGEKPFKCAFCDKSFVQYDSLRTHVKKHDGRSQGFF